MSDARAAAAGRDRAPLPISLGRTTLEDRATVYDSSRTKRPVLMPRH